MEKYYQAKLNNLRQSPRKVRLVADLIRGKTVDKALLDLNMLAKKASLPLKKLVSSAASNAKNLGAETNLFIKKISVDGGTILYRRRYRARGRAAPIRKRTSHISLVLAEQEQGNSKHETRNSKQSQISNVKNKKTKSV